MSGLTLKGRGGLALLCISSAFGIFFFIPPISIVVVLLLILCVGGAIGFSISLIVPWRFALYSAIVAMYCLFLLSEHVVSIELVSYLFIILFFVEVFIGRRLL